MRHGISKRSFCKSDNPYFKQPLWGLSCCSRYLSSLLNIHSGGKQQSCTPWNRCSIRCHLSPGFCALSPFLADTHKNEVLGKSTDDPKQPYFLLEINTWIEQWILCWFSVHFCPSLPIFTQEILKSPQWPSWGADGKTSVSYLTWKLLFCFFFFLPRIKV